MEEVTFCMPSGIHSNKDLVLTHFVANAYPRKAEHLRGLLNMHSSDPGRELKRAVKQLEDIVNSDGARRAKKPEGPPRHGSSFGGTAAPAQGSTSSNNNKRKDARPHHANKKPRPDFEKRDFSRTICHYRSATGEHCGENGHTTGYHLTLYPDGSVKGGIYTVVTTTDATTSRTKPVPVHKPACAYYTTSKNTDSETR